MDLRPLPLVCVMLLGCSLLAPSRDEVIGTRPDAQTGGAAGNAGAAGCPALGPPGTFPSTQVLDTFTYPNGPFNSGAWIGDKGAFSIADATLVAAAGSLENSIAWSAVGCADQEVYVRFTQIDTSAKEHFLRLKQPSTSPDCAGIEVAYRSAGDADPSDVRVRVCEPGGVTTHVGSSGAVLVDGDVLGARARADGSVEVYVNGNLLLEQSVGPAAGTPWSLYAEPGRFGFGMTDSTGAAVFDDFGGG